MPASSARRVQIPGVNLPLGTCTEVPLVVTMKPAQVPPVKSRFTVAPYGFVIATPSGAPAGTTAPLVGFLIVMDCLSTLTTAFAVMTVRIDCCCPDVSLVFGYGAENPKAV